MALRTPIGTGDADDDRVRFEEIWSDHDLLRNYCRRIVGDTPLIDDMVQEAFAEAFLKLDGLERRSSFLPWLATVAKRRGLNELRRYRYATPVEDLPEQPSRVDHDPAEVVARRDQVERLREALVALTPRERDLLLGQVNDGSSISELAQQASSTPASVRSVLLRARTKLRAQIEDGTAWAFLPLAKLGDWARRRFGPLSTRAGDATPFVEVAYQRLGEVVVAMVVVTGSLAGSGGGGSAPSLVLGRTEALEAAASYLPGWMFGASAPSDEAGAAEVSVRGARSETSAVSAPIETSAAPPSETPPPSGGNPYSWPFAAPAPNPGEPPVTPPEPPPSPINNQPAEQPDDANFLDFAVTKGTDASASPQVFALGDNAGSCQSNCRVLFTSTDGGATWRKLPGHGLDGAMSILVAPNFPLDSRIYAMAADGLWLSRDGGTTFAHVNEPQPGPAAMSPLFSDGDERILVGSQPAVVYDAKADQPTPFSAAPMTGSSNTFAFAPDYATSQVLLAGSAVNGPTAVRRALVYRCVAEECDDGTELPGLMGSPTVGFASTYATDGLTFAWRDDHLFRSDRQDPAFARVASMPRVGVIKDVSDDGGGSFFAAAIEAGSGFGGLLASADQGRTWARRGTGTPLEKGVEALVVLGKGRVLAAPVGTAGSGLLCSMDSGLTWAGRCG